MRRASALTAAELSGDVTTSGSNAGTIANAAVSLAKMANLAQDLFIGRTTASPGVPETATITAAARTVLDAANVVSGLEQMRGGGMAQGVDVGGLGDVREAQGTRERLAGGGFAQVMPAHDPGARIAREAFAGE